VFASVSASSVSHLFSNKLNFSGATMTAKDYLSGREAAAFLDVKPATLYAYVSRGLIRSVPSNVNPRRKIRQYLLEDLEKVKMRADARHGHGPVAAEAVTRRCAGASR
jgi:hypothetical protein